MATPQIFAIRVHSPSDGIGRIPYLLVGNRGDGSVDLDFGNLIPEADRPIANATLSLDGLYKLLCGNRCRINQSGDSIWLTVGGDSVLITRSIDGKPTARSYSVSFVELALAWNLLAGPRTE